MFILGVQILDEGSFENTIKNSTKPIIIDFYADWCGPCKMVAPILDKIVEETENITIYKVNVDSCQSLAEQFSVMTIPSLISFKDGKEHKRIIGVQSKENILALID